MITKASVPCVLPPRVPDLAVDNEPPAASGPERGPYTWYYPEEIAHDLDGIDIPDRFKGEILACAWEYARCVIPHYTNWARYVAFMRTIVVATVAEFRGVDITSGHNNQNNQTTNKKKKKKKKKKVLNYDLDALLSTVFGDAPGHEEMVQEFRTFCVLTTTKIGQGRGCELFRRYVNVLTSSPRLWFRLRDCDGLARYVLVASLRCNDLPTWFSEDQFEILGEIADTLYDAVAYFKHRSEGEIHSTFAYLPLDTRTEAFRHAREVLWALDTAWASRPGLCNVTNFVRIFGGPLHLMARRYRFVEDGLTVYIPQTEDVIDQVRQNFKLWNRLDAAPAPSTTGVDVGTYRELVNSEEGFLFPWLAELLESKGDVSCPQCQYPESYGVSGAHGFGGVKLCSECTDKWRVYRESLDQRAMEAFPEVSLSSCTGRGKSHCS